MPDIDRETPRSIGVIAIVMLLLIVLGFVGLGIVMKMNGYPRSDMIRWTPLALNLRQNGHWLLALPVAWFVCATVVFRADRATIPQMLAYVIGTALLIIVPILFLFAIFHSYTRPLLIGVEPTQTSSPTTGGARPVLPLRTRD